MIDRRKFIASTAVCGVASLLPFYSSARDTLNGDNSPSSEYKMLVEELLKEWCDGMIVHQIIDPSRPELHGALWCPACQKIHGRCMDAVYPFMHMANKTGEKKYLNAAILSMQWSNNVSKEDGSWTVIPDPKSWAGITVFGAIALAEALHYHSDILPTAIEQQWRQRLAKAANYVYKHFDLTFTNINYGATAIYAFLLIGKELNDPKLVKRSHELAKGIKRFFTQPNQLLFGEGKPSQAKSPKGLLPIDLGYNVEESLNALVMYALHENDQELLTLLDGSLASHLQFMLPDGAWDNSWGTRQAKWSYWGSRTTDGSQLAFGLMAKRNHALGSAAYLNTELLKKCTADGLLHGGPHYVSHGIKPCIHHTFAHAKPLAFLLDNQQVTKHITKTQPIPRATEYGVKHFSELDVWLVARGNWRATVSSYDALYKEGNQYIQQATGGSLAMLWHSKTGPLMAASMPKYELVEKNNQQPQPHGEDIALTPRVEAYDKNGTWYTNLYDLSAKVDVNQHTNNEVRLTASIQVKDQQSRTLNSNEVYSLEYRFSQDKVTISAQRSQASQQHEALSRLVLPIVVTSDESYSQPEPNKIEIQKQHSVVVVQSNMPIQIRKTAAPRVFNMVPGMEAIVLDISMSGEISKGPKSTERYPVTCQISVV